MLFLLLFFHNCSPKRTIYCKIHFKLQYFHQKEHHEDCELLVAPIVAQSVCKFCTKFFYWCLLKEQRIRFVKVQQVRKRTETDNDGQTVIHRS